MIHPVIPGLAEREPGTYGSTSDPEVVHGASRGFRFRFAAPE